ncbi:MAG: tetratricopeptide repeat protein [Desulfovibrio sp.]|jgi:tetratricopeptide (TPR) repeat protein|nr:tetratricopeptide repeat protein [Desulfovibrio sp.]
MQIGHYTYLRRATFAAAPVGRSKAPRALPIRQASVIATISLLSAMIILPCLFCRTSLAGQDADAAPAGETLKAKVRQMDPSAWRLSPEAEQMYYYLLLADGMNDNSRLTVMTAIDGLLKVEPSLPVFRESAGILLSGKEFDDAENIALRGLRHFPGDTVLTLLLAGTYGEKGETAHAASLLEEHLAVYPGQREVIEELARLYLQNGQKEKAVDMLAALPIKDASPEDMLFRAKALSLLERPAEAVETLRRLLDKEANFYEGWVAIGHLYLQDKKLAEAAASFTKAAELADSPNLWFRIALIHIERKLPGEALNALDKIPASPDIYIQAALRFADGQYFTEAEELLNRALKNGANPDEIALLLSAIKEESGKDSLTCLEPLKRISPASPLYPKALYQKARIYLQAKQYAKSYAVASEGSKRFPELKELWGIEAYALVKLDQNAKAEKILKKALEHHVGDEELLFTLGTVQDDANKKNEAIKTMERILAVNPKNYQALNYVGYSLAEKNINLHHALKLITAALEQNPDADYIVDSLAWVHYRLGNIEEAWKNINRCISLGGDDPTMWEHYGDIANAMDRREEAIKGYTESIARKPANIADIRKKLSALQKK